MDAPGHIKDDIRLMNRLRRDHPGAAASSPTSLPPRHQRQRALLRSKKTRICGFPPVPRQSTRTSRRVPASRCRLWEFGLPDDASIEVQDLLHGNTFTWHGKTQWLDARAAHAALRDLAAFRAGGCRRMNRPSTPEPAPAMRPRPPPARIDAASRLVQGRDHLPAAHQGLPGFERRRHRRLRRPDAAARLCAGTGRHGHLAPAVLPLAAARRRLRHRRLQGDQPVLRRHEGLSRPSWTRRTGAGLRVITELVINHTSDQHPWFQRARACQARFGGARLLRLVGHRREMARDADHLPRHREVELDLGSGRRAYYWHRFYSHQPDLNFDNPRVLPRC
jgi:hypothetical protein